MLIEKNDSIIHIFLGKFLRKSYPISASGAQTLYSFITPFYIHFSTLQHLFFKVGIIPFKNS
ncbi:hypothetical protein BIV59_16025 [Bacillus sp. MUM 13]|nr:hypothetical protein BIV59_16025 [Bacillus sp. MUM 13]